jgi:hypothetical protein
MSKSMETYYEQVKGILTKWAKARDDDMLLYSIFLHMNGYVKPEERFYDVFPKAKERGLPSYEGVTRARRKVQEKEPYLRGERYSQRKKAEEEYHDYYRDN